MTREEAAKICQSIKFLMDKEDYSEEVEEALNMAIAALKQLSLPKIIIRQGEQEPSAQLFTSEQIQTMQELESAQIEKAYELGEEDRPTGHWIEDEKQNVLMRKFMEKGEEWRVCSVCGAGIMIGAEYETDKCYHETFLNYCPNCGADMRGGEEE